MKKYTAMCENTSCDTSYDIWLNSGHIEEGEIGEFENFSDAKKAVIKAIDEEVSFLRRRRAEIKSLKKADVFEPKGEYLK